MDHFFTPSDRRAAEDQARERPEIEPSPETKPVDVEIPIVAKVQIFTSNGNMIKQYDATTTPEYNDESGMWEFETDYGTVTLASNWQHFLVVVVEFFEDEETPQD